MIGVYWLLTALLGGDPCSAAVEAPVVDVDPRSMEIKVSRRYGVPWAICAQEKGGKQPLLRITATDGAGKHVLLEQAVNLASSLRDGMNNFSASADGCRDAVLDRRAPDAVLQGPVGLRRWHNRRAIEVELIAEGALAPLAFKTQTEVFCRACSDGVSSSYYQNDFDKNTTRLVVSVDKPRYECSKGGGRLMVRRFWADPNVDTWVPLRPYEVLDNLQERLKPNGDSMMYELIEPAARSCKAGKTSVFEIVGIDEYAVLRTSYGPSESIQRGSVEFLRCK